LDTLDQQNRKLEAISNCNQILMRAEDEQTLLNDICRIICDDVGYRLVWVGYAENDDAKTIRPVAWDGFDSGYIADAQLSWSADTERGRCPGGKSIRSGEIVYIQDFTTDPLMAPWRESALQRGYHSTIALPLKDENANSYGVLLIYSTEINAFPPDELRLLEELAGDLAFGIMVLRTRSERKLVEEALKESITRLNEAQYIAHLGSWNLDIENDVLTWSEEIYRIFEIDPNKFGATYKAFLDAIHPDDRDAVNFAYTNSLKTRMPYAIDHRLLFADGRIKYVHEQCETFYDADRRPLRSIGVVQNITERKESEEAAQESGMHYRQIVDLSQDMIVIHQYGKVVFINEAGVRLVGASSPGQIIGRSVLEFVPPDYREIARERIQIYMKGAGYKSAVYEQKLLRLDGTKINIDLRGMPIHYKGGEAIQFIARDITERKQKEDERNEHIRFLENLALVDQAIKEETDVEKMLTSVVNTVLSIFDCDRIWLVFPCDPDAASFRVPVEVYKPEYPGAKVLNVDVPMSPGESRNMREALESDNPVTYTAGTDRPIMTAKQFSVQSQMFIPIYPKIGKPWVFGMHQCSQPRVWTKEEQQLFKEISRRVADSLTSLLMLQNLKESKRVKTELLEKLNEAQNIAMIGSWEWDLLTNLVWWSDETYRIFGITEQNFVPDFETSGKFIYPDDIATYGKSFEHSLQTGEPLDIDFRLITNDGLLKTCQSKGKIVYNDSHKPVRFIGTIMDITEHKRREDALQRMNRELRAISDCNQVMMRAEDEQTLLNDICRIICDDVGYRLVWVGYAENDDAKTIRPVAWDGFDNGYIADAQLSWSADTERGRCPGGESIRSGKIVCIQDFASDLQMASWCESALQRGYHSAIALPLKDENANVFGVLLIYSTEINAFPPDELRLLEELSGDLAFGIIVLRTRTERRHVEEELRIASLYARSLIEASLDPLVTISPDGKITDVNKATESVTGVSRKQLIFSDFTNYFTEQGKAKEGYQKVLEQGFVRDYPLTILHTSGKTTDVLYNATVYRNESGELKGVFAAAHDITVRKQAEEEIRILNQELENRVAVRTAQLEVMNKELESFAYSVSHDLRAPLRGIDGFSQVLLEEYKDKVDEQGKDYLHRVRSASQRMGQLIDDMLNLSRVSCSEINIQQVNLSEMFREISDELLEIQPERQVEFIVQKGIKARGDSHLLRIVLENLIGNAWKFTSNHPTAQIEFGMQLQNEVPVYFIRDDGAGFNMKYTQKLFGAFQRLHSTTEFPGTGIGFATVQRVIHRHGGKVWAEGEIEKGATFYFTIT